LPSNIGKRDFGVRIDEEKEEQGFDFNIKKELQNKKELSDYKIECFTTSDANKLVGDLQIKSSATESINIVNPVVKTASWQDIIISYPTVFGENN
jgi:hypothetical protein